jgi:hypothetical protein
MIVGKRLGGFGELGALGGLPPGAGAVGGIVDGGGNVDGGGTVVVVVVVTGGDVGGGVVGGGVVTVGLGSGVGDVVGVGLGSGVGDTCASAGNGARTNARTASMITRLIFPPLLHWYHLEHCPHNHEEYDDGQYHRDHEHNHDSDDLREPNERTGKEVRTPPMFSLV